MDISFAGQQRLLALNAAYTHAPGALLVFAQRSPRDLHLPPFDHVMHSVNFSWPCGNLRLLILKTDFAESHEVLTATPPRETLLTDVLHDELASSSIFSRAEAQQPAAQAARTKTLDETSRQLPLITRASHGRLLVAVYMQLQ